VIQEAMAFPSFLCGPRLCNPFGSVEEDDYEWETDDLETDHFPIALVRRMMLYHRPEVLKETMSRGTLSMGVFTKGKHL
jgi:hypothetical protein